VHICSFYLRKGIAMIRVLVIEDDLSVGVAIRLTLAREGGETIHIDGAYAGIRAFESANFDLVIVDLFMPEMNGLQIITEVHARAPTMPIIAMSGFRFRDSMDPRLDLLGMAVKAGATAVLPKPFKPSQLTAAVEASLRQAPADIRRV
jgi:DNA-binding response OmpR family regulator